MAKKLQFWRIFVIGSKARYIGVVRAANPDSAIKLAIEQLEVADPDTQRRLAARPQE